MSGAFGWELAGRTAVAAGLAGLLGVVGRLVAVWLRHRGKIDRP